MKAPRKLPLLSKKRRRRNKSATRRRFVVHQSANTSHQIEALAAHERQTKNGSPAYISDRLLYLAAPFSGGRSMVCPKTNTLMLLSAAVAVLALTIPGTCDADGAATPSPPAWTVPDIDKLPDDASGKLVRYGRDLVSKTSSLIGPEVADAEKRFAGNNLDCQSCHISAGTQKFRAPARRRLREFSGICGADRAHRNDRRARSKLHGAQYERQAAAA